MFDPPDLDLPFNDDRERATVLARFLGLCIELESWHEYAMIPELLTPARRRVVKASTQLGDTPEQILARWIANFRDELEAAFDSRNRVVHGLRLSDRELRGAEWLARQLLQLIEHPTAA
jgi:hypothetical protein